MAKKLNGDVAGRRDLHDGKSLWADSKTTKFKCSVERSNKTADIIVVGAGISGSVTALVLAANGHEVLLVDRRRPGEGSTVASTAMIQFEIDTPLIKLADKIGQDKATRAYLRSARAVSDLRDLLARHEIDGDWIDRDALYLSGNKMGMRGLKVEVDARRAIGLPSQFINKQALSEQFNIDRTAAILSSGSGELDPAKTSAGCLAAATKLGATVIAPCEVVRVSSTPAGVELQTAEGHTLKCRRAIFATGYEVIAGVPRQAFDIISSWAIATQQLPDAGFWPMRCLIWEAADPYLYLRTTADNRILAGGEDSGLLDPNRRARAIGPKSKKLISKVRRLLNRSDLRVDYAWAGAFADSPTGLPIFKELPDLPGVLAILGCGGNGITFSMIASDVVSAWIEGKRDPDADLFAGLW
jgi:glycine/D-amino acid oxidase-like deaminating enzyme